MENITNWKFEQDGFKIAIKSRKAFNEELIDIVLSGPFKGARCQTPEVFLFAKYKQFITKRIVIDDIVGNGYFTGIQGNGTGTLMFNLVLQVLKQGYGDDIEVTGELSSIQDPEQSPLKERCSLNRERFWKSFGFKIVVDELDRQIITAKLGELSYRHSDRMIDGKLSTFVELDKFEVSQ